VQKVDIEVCTLSAGWLLSKSTLRTRVLLPVRSENWREFIITTVNDLSPAPKVDYIQQEAQLPQEIAHVRNLYPFQSHSRSLILILIESPPATSY